MPVSLLNIVGYFVLPTTWTYFFRLTSCMIAVGFRTILTVFSLGQIHTVLRWILINVVRRYLPEAAVLYIFSHNFNGFNLIPVVNSVCDIGFTFIASLCHRVLTDGVTCRTFKHGVPLDEYYLVDSNSQTTWNPFIVLLLDQ